MLQLAVVGEQQQPFAVGIEAPRRIKSGKRNIVGERGMQPVPAELANHAIRLVEKQNAAHYVFLGG